MYDKVKQIGVGMDGWSWNNNYDAAGSLYFFTITLKGKMMENQIKCPNCKKTISNNPILENAAIGGEHTMGSEFIICECGERISYWAMRDQLRNQKTFGRKIQNWFHTLTKN